MNSTDSFTAVSTRLEDDGDTNQNGAAGFLHGGGEMGSLIRAKDWSTTSLGPPDSWPQSLKTVVRIMLDSRYAMWLGWGPDLTFLYNDAYRPTLDKKHPAALGAPSRNVWAEIWPEIGPRIEQVLRSGEATWDEGLRLFLERSGFPEETYHTFSHSPIYDDDGAVNGHLCVVTEETENFIAQRRLRLLRDMAARLASINTESESIDAIQQGLEADSHDLTFALLYRIDGDRSDVAVRVNVPPDHVAVCDPARVQSLWSIDTLMADRNLAIIDDLRSRCPHIPAGIWSEPPTHAVVARVAARGGERDEFVFVAGLNPFRPIDDAYRGFIDLIVRQIASGLSAARAYESERARAESLEELDRAKTAFFANVSHEFRTPLTLMLGPIQDALQRSESAPPEELKADLDLIHRNSLRLLKLVNTLLDFSRIEAGRIEAAYEPTDLSALTCEIASTFRSTVERAGIRLTTDCPPLREPVYVDRTMWEKIVLNLLSNAFKHTFEGEIEVRVREDGLGAELSIRDTGTGIEAKDIGRLFERFYRVRGARSRTHEGSGIGLALVQDLLRLHGGAIRVESEVGVGSVFTAAIPFGRAHLSDERIGKPRESNDSSTCAEAFAQEAMRWIPDGEAVDDESVAPSFVAAPMLEAGPSRAPGARIVLADDNADMRDYMRRLLAATYRVEPVPDGLAALDAIRRERPDLVISDVMMPGLDGLELLKEIRRDPQISDLPVMLLSARAGEESRISGLGAGADDYLIKPFNARELIARVGAQLSLSRLRQEALQRERVLRNEAEALNSVALDLTAELDLRALIQKVTDAGTLLTDAQFGAFFYNTTTESGESFLLYTLSGAPREAFEKLGMPRNTALFGPTFRGEKPIRLADVRADPRYGRSSPHFGVPEGHLPVRSYLAVPVISRSGAVLGGLFFGHADAGVFTERSERLALGIAAQAAIAIDNAQLFTQSKNELESRVRVESALRGSEQRYRQLVDSLPAAVYTTDVHGKIELYNDAAVALWGGSPTVGQEAWCGPSRIFRPDGTPLPIDDYPMAVALREGRAVRGEEIVIERPDGTRRIVLPHPEPLHDASGNMVGAIDMLIDVTDRRHAERAQALLANIVESSDDSIISKNLDGIILSWNRGAEHVFGYTAKEAVGRSIMMLVPPERHAEERAILARLRSGEHADHFETVRVARDGRSVEISMTVSPLHDASGRIIGASQVARDITSQKHSAAELATIKDDLSLQVAGLTRMHELVGTLVGVHELDSALREILRALVDVHRADCGLISLYDPATGVMHSSASVRFNTQHLKQWNGIRPTPESGGACGRAFTTRKRVIVEDVEVDPSFAPFRELARSVGFRAVHSTPIITRAGEALGVISVHFAGRRQPTPLEQQLADMCARYAADVIESARDQEALRQSEEKFRNLADAMSQFAWIADGRGWIFWFNKRWLEFTGTLLEKVSGWDWTSVLHPQHSQRVVERIQRSFNTGEPWEDTFPIQGKDGEYRWFLSRALPVRDPSGRIIRWFGTHTDITEQRQSESALKKAKEIAEAANRAKDRFLAMLSHELRTPLTPVLMAAASIQSDPTLSPQLRDDISMIRRNVELEAKLIDDLLDISRITSGKLSLNRQIVDVNNTVRHVCAICEAQIVERRIVLRSDLAPDAGTVVADPARMQQILWNILKNAAKFVSDGGGIFVSTSSQDGFARIQVRDDGIGIAPDFLPHVFDAFSQDKPDAAHRFGGLGLGLAISKALVELHDGVIRAESPGLGMGTTFTVEFPIRTNDPARRPSESAPPRPIASQAARVLLIEDHADTAKILARLLTGAGYVVTVAHCGADALKCAADGLFDIVICDIGLPDMPGHDVIRSIRCARAIPGIAMSGFGMDEDFRKSHSAGFCEHLIKPVQFDQLQAAVERVLAAQPTASARSGA